MIQHICRAEMGPCYLGRDESLAFGEEGQAGYAGNHQAQGGGQVKDGGKPLAIGQETRALARPPMP